MKQILLIVAAVVFLTFSILFVTRISGLKNQFAPQPHPFNTENFEIIAHRGGAGEAPENTIEAFKSATKISKNIILETDTQMTSDGNMILLHDKSFLRTTGIDKTPSELTYEEITKLDAGYAFQNNSGQFPFRNKGIKIPLLKETLSTFQDQRLIIELKTDSQTAADKLIQVIEETKSEDRVVIGSKFTKALEYIREKRPDWIYSATPTEMFQTIMLMNLYIETIAPLEAETYLLPEKLKGIKVLTPRLVQEIQRRKKPIFVWTVNDDNEVLRLKKMGINGVVTDYPGRIYDLVRSF